MTRGDVVLAQLSPIIGSEADRRRPVVLVGSNMSLRAVERHQRGVVTVVPLTSNLRWRGRMHVLIDPSLRNGLARRSKAQAEQVRSIDGSRILSPLGQLSATDLRAVDDALRFHLELG